MFLLVPAPGLRLGMSLLIRLDSLPDCQDADHRNRRHYRQ